MAQLRSKPVSMTIANNEHYALRRRPEKDSYTTVSGEFTTKEETKSGSDPTPAKDRSGPQIYTPRDLKFRAVGPSIDTRGTGPKELHMRFQGIVEWSVESDLKELHINHQAPGQKALINYLYHRKPAGLSQEVWARVERYGLPLISLDLELWLSSSGTPVPWRDSSLSEIDTDFSANAPLSRSNLAEYVALHNGDHIDGASPPLKNFGKINTAPFTVKTKIDRWLPLPIASIDSIATKVVPVVNLHIGGRALGADKIRVELELDGALFYTVD